MTRESPSLTSLQKPPYASSVHLNWVHECPSKNGLWFISSRYRMEDIPPCFRLVPTLLPAMCQVRPATICYGVLVPDGLADRFYRVAVNRYEADHSVRHLILALEDQKGGCVQEPQEAVDLQPQLWTISQVSQALNLGRTKIYELIGREHLPVRKFGRAVRVSPVELQRWLEARKEQ